MLEDGVLDYSIAQHAKIPLSNGSLLLMDGACQTDWQVLYLLLYTFKQERFQN